MTRKFHFFVKTAKSVINKITVYNTVSYDTYPAKMSKTRGKSRKRGKPEKSWLQVWVLFISLYPDKRLHDFEGELKWGMFCHIWDMKNSCDHLWVVALLEEVDHPWNNLTS